MLPLVFLAVLGLARADVLTPPYFNLADGKEITATATCGVGSPGPELYCQLVGANSEQEANLTQNIIQGQVRGSLSIDLLVLFFIFFFSLWGIRVSRGSRHVQPGPAFRFLMESIFREVYFDGAP